MCILRPAFLLLALLSLGACYHPLYGDKSFGGGTASVEETRLNQVGIASIPDQRGQLLRNELIDRFYTSGRPAKPDTILGVNLTVDETQLGIQSDGTATRMRLDLTANYTLTDAHTAKVLYTGFSRAVVDYNILSGQYATMSSKDNAVAKGVRDLAGLITTRISLALQGLSQGKNYTPPVAPDPATDATAQPLNAPALPKSDAAP